MNVRWPSNCTSPSNGDPAPAGPWRRDAAGDRLLEDRVVAAPRPDRRRRARSALRLVPVGVVVVGLPDAVAAAVPDVGLGPWRRNRRTPTRPSRSRSVVLAPPGIEYSPFRPFQR